jgi:glycolate oxidase FAD binding subunit
LGTGELPSCREGGPADQLDGSTVRLVAAPRSLDELRQVVRHVQDRGLVVLPRGSGSKITWLQLPPVVDVLLDMSGFAQDVYDPETTSVTVGAGAKLATVQDELARKGRRLGLDSPSQRATAGGIVVAAEIGPMTHHFGQPAGQVCDATVVLPDGTVTGLADRATLLGGGVFDLRWAYPGWPNPASVVAELNLLTHALPEAQCWLTLPVTQPVHVTEMRDEIMACDPAVVAIELDVPGMRRGAVAPHERFATGSLSVLLEGSREQVVDRARALAQALDHRQVHSSGEPPVWWGRYPFRLGEVAVRLQILDDGLHVLCYALADAMGAPVPVRGSVQGGVGWAALPGDLSPMRLVSVLEAVRGVLMARGGTAVVQAAPLHLRDFVAPYRNP